MAEKETITPTKAVQLALRELLPWKDDDIDLSDKEVRGPRGGHTGRFNRAPGAFRTCYPLTWGAVCDVNHCDGEIEHGHAYHTVFLGAGSYPKERFWGPTFRDDIETHAILRAVTSTAQSRRAWPPEGMDIDQLRTLIEEEKHLIVAERILAERQRRAEEAKQSRKQRKEVSLSR